MTRKGKVIHVIDNFPLLITTPIFLMDVISNRRPYPREILNHSLFFHVDQNMCETLPSSFTRRIDSFDTW